MSIGENIRKYRVGKQITQKELASEIGVTQSMIAQIERGTKTLTLPLGKEMARALDVNLEDLTKWIGVVI